MRCSATSWGSGWLRPTARSPTGSFAGSRSTSNGRRRSSIGAPAPISRRVSPERPSTSGRRLARRLRDVVGRSLPPRPPPAGSEDVHELLGAPAGGGREHLHVAGTDRDPFGAALSPLCEHLPDEPGDQIALLRARAFDRREIDLGRGTSLDRSQDLAEHTLGTDVQESTQFAEPHQRDLAFPALVSRDRGRPEAIGGDLGEVVEGHATLQARAAQRAPDLPGEVFHDRSSMRSDSAGRAGPTVERRSIEAYPAKDVGSNVGIVRDQGDSRWDKSPDALRGLDAAVNARVEGC